MNMPKLSRNQQHSNKEPLLNISNWMKIQIANLCKTVPAPVAATRDVLAERLQSIGETASSLYNRMMDNIEYGQKGLGTENERSLEGAYRSFAKPVI